MSANPEVPAAPRLRAIREAWLGRAVERLEADPAISAAGFVGSLGRGVADAKVIFDEQGLHRLDDRFREHQDKRDVQPPAPKAPNAHRLLPVSLIAVAAKYVARRSADAGRMVEFVGAPCAPAAVPAEYLAILRRLLVQYRDDAPEEMLTPVSRYLDLAEAVL